MRRVLNWMLAIVVMAAVLVTYLGRPIRADKDVVALLVSCMRAQTCRVSTVSAIVGDKTITRIEKPIKVTTSSGVVVEVSYYTTNFQDLCVLLVQQDSGEGALLHDKNLSGWVVHAVLARRMGASDVIPFEEVRVEDLPGAQDAYVRAIHIAEEEVIPQPEKAVSQPLS